MAHETFQLTVLTRLLDDEIRLMESFGLPEVSALDDSDRKCRSTLQAKARVILEDHHLSPPLKLFRRRFWAKVELDEIEVSLDPPKRIAEWEVPVKLRLQYLRWVEDGMHQAWVPGLGVLVFGTRADLLPKRLDDHIRLVLAGRRKHVTLQELAGIARVRSMALDTLEVTAHLKTPRQIAADGEEEDKKKSTLSPLADELPPCVVNKTTPEAKAPAQSAFEMEDELAQLAEALSRAPRSSVLLVGPAGCGKTALVHELARRRRDFKFSETPFWSTSGARLMSGQIGFGMWQERCQKMVREAGKTNAIVHFNSLAELLEVGKTTRQEQSVGGFLRPSIARGDLLVIAECTPEQLGAIERLEPHLLGAFRQLAVPERTPEQARTILDRLYEAAPGPSLPAGSRSETSLALNRLHLLHQRYATYSARPGRAVRFLKNVLADRFPEKVLTEELVTTRFSSETGLPPVLLDDRVPLDLVKTEGWFTQRVIGQPQAVAHVLDLLATIKGRLARPRKPLASLLFIGPTGTGKTELAKSMATFLFGDASRMARFDLNEFSDPISVLRLIGGTGACDAEGLLTARVREQPFSVLLLDEFEKADPAFFDLLLQVLGDGRLTDASGRVADFCNTVIVMTSNLGAQGFQRGPAGFRADGATTRDAQEHFTSAVRTFLRPEIFNRLDAVVPFQPLSAEIVLAIAHRQLDLICQRDGLRLRPVELRIAPSVAAHLATRGYDVRYGARPLKRTIERELLVPLAEALNEYETKTPLRAAIDVINGQLRIEVNARKEAMAEAAITAARAGAELANEVMKRRRRIGRMIRGSAVSALEDRMAMLIALERRLARTNKETASADPRLAALPRLKECLGQVSTLAERISALEDIAVGAVYRSETLDHGIITAKLADITTDLKRLQRDVFRLQHPEADNIILVLYSEHRETLFQFVTAYRKFAETAGKFIAMEYFRPPTGGRTSAVRLVREKVEKPEAFFIKPPELVIGIALHLRGELFQPRLAEEAGIHELKVKEARHTCLIQVADPPLSNYHPPPGIEIKGGIKAMGADTCRWFDSTSGKVGDCTLDTVRPWPFNDLERCVAELTQERLTAAIEAATL